MIPQENDNNTSSPCSPTSSSSSSSSGSHSSITNPLDKELRDSTYENYLPYKSAKVLEQPRIIMLKIDNLPPGKNWKQIKYLIGGIIHHSNILQVKLLPPMTSVVPPFVALQSCIIILKGSLNQNSINELVMTLNTYQWDYHDLYSYVLPSYDQQQSFYSYYYNQMPGNNRNAVGQDPQMLYLQRNMANFNLENDESTTLSNSSSSPETQNLSPRMGTSPPFPMIPTTFPSNLTTASPNILSNFQMQTNPSNTSPPGNVPGPIPPPPLPHHQRLPAGNMPNPYSMYPPVPTMRYPFANPSAPNFIRRSYYDQSTLAKFNINPNGRIIAASVKKNTNPFKQPKKLKNIFNEKNFRKQMTDRGMWQFKIHNFPPYLLAESMRPLSKNAKDSIKIDIETDSIDKYAKLRWTVLKDFIKLKCPKLLNLASSSNKSEHGNVENTREFYVGVYESSEHELVVKVNDDIFIIDCICYNAIIGFHDKELFELCLSSLKDQEYSLGYILQVEILPPYDNLEESNTPLYHNHNEQVKLNNSNSTSSL
ncbi:hypothetical protein KAFR_0I01800 [Kazachstania africana CBS 2517]|uniref:Uncharacterized protein n=1 Tax=Kazachstania africana (strain ATCC 22294 / BCRC 22015 / CBS 2517 / CECT 1963 / NBRC 1671 / NRRL Y-8276) TaxID=1071382 RepID=H2B011_KAZAF|nr:hypothetical protein KAFR_0I01800 [Kazachstania africana CBS 2517]CCF59961.1 hypothetical protein KAFR_0I01800 [Kazachstania africana CBS 2517]